MPESKDQRLLTEAELELMSVLWASGGATVREVMAALPADRQPAYTTVSTVLRILEKKGFVTSRKQGRSHRYAPALGRERYQARQLRHTLGSLFGGSPSALVRRLLSSTAVGADELADLRRLLDEGAEE